MGRPTKSQLLADIAATAWFSGEGSAEAATIVRQRGTGVYELTNGSKTEKFRIGDALPGAEGEACIRVNPHGAGGSTSTATATATLDSGDSVDSITVTDGGSGYLEAPTVTISGDGSGATATATISGGVVTGITVTDAGSGYTGAPTVTLSAPTGGDVEFARTLHNRTVRTHEGNTYKWVAGEATSADGEAEIIG